MLLLTFSDNRYVGRDLIACFRSFVFSLNAPLKTIWFVFDQKLCGIRYSLNTLLRMLSVQRMSKSKGFHFRLHLKDVSDAENLGGEIPWVLQKSARDGTPSTTSPPGLLVSNSFKVLLQQ